MTLLQAIVLGIVQGLTEFLPISSTAHLRIVPALFGWHFDYAGTTQRPRRAVHRGHPARHHRWRSSCTSGASCCTSPSPGSAGCSTSRVRGTLEYRLGWYLILATIPVGVFGLVFSHQIETGARNLWLIACALIALASCSPRRAGRHAATARRSRSTRTRRASSVGAAQALALIPGASRSGTTITAGLFRGLTREAAARFSFLLSIPAVVLSGLYEARQRSATRRTRASGSPAWRRSSRSSSGSPRSHWLMRWLANHSTFIFIYYRIALGVLLIVLLVHRRPARATK